MAGKPNGKTETAAPTPTKKKTGPKPTTPAVATTSNGAGPQSTGIPVELLLKQELALIETRAGRIRKALEALRGVAR